MLVENPTFPPLLDLFQLAGARVVGLALDDHGVRPDALERALSVRPAAMYLQPRAQNPTGISTTPARVAALAVVLEASPRDIASAPAVSLGTYLPVRRARAEYADRRSALVTALTTRGGATTGTDGINLWVRPDRYSVWSSSTKPGATIRASGPAAYERPIMAATPYPWPAV